MSSPATTRHRWADAWAVYTRPRVVAMLFLGFASGLPLLLVFGTLSAWLREAGIDRSTIGHVSWVATLYALKFVWAPLVDRIDLPVLHRLLGHRRSWMLLAQVGVIAGLLLMAAQNPQQSLEALVWAALMVAFSSATQDISIDAWRIEAVDVEYQAAMAATYQMGYRVGMIASGAGALYLAEFGGWGIAYTTMAALMGFSVLTTLLIPEPEQRVSKDTWKDEARVVAFVERSAHLPGVYRRVAAWFIGAVVCPFTEFFQRNGRFALLILAFVGVFRISDITMGVMANPFYIDKGYSLADIASVTKVFGVVMTMLGAAVGGVLVARFGVLRMLLVAAIMVALTNLAFAWLATQQAHIAFLAIVVSADNLSGGMAGSAFIAYLSGQTNRAYTATQYALFSSLMLLPAKFLAGFSGDIVDATSYHFFFTYAAALGLPAVVLVLLLMRRERLKSKQCNT
jgi:MFS transporter, PAT family, beta-lactamase induction signal transducer AmpG